MKRASTLRGKRAAQPASPAIDAGGAVDAPAPAFLPASSGGGPEYGPAPVAAPSGESHAPPLPGWENLPLDAPPRADLPSRRPLIARPITWGTTDFLVQLGPDPAGRVREAFVDPVSLGAKFGSDTHVVLQESAMLLSLALSVGFTAEWLAGYLGTREQDELAGLMATPGPMCLAAEDAAKMERDCGQGLRELFTYKPVMPVKPR